MFVTLALAVDRYWKVVIGFVWGSSSFKPTVVSLLHYQPIILHGLSFLQSMGIILHRHLISFCPPTPLISFFFFLSLFSPIKQQGSVNARQKKKKKNEKNRRVVRPLSASSKWDKPCDVVLLFAVCLLQPCAKSRLSPRCFVFFFFPSSTFVFVFPIVFN